MRSLRSSVGFRTFVLDQLEPLNVTPRSMFGGTGLYAGGVFFGIIAMDRLYLKVGDSNRSMFERAGSRPFKPYPGRPLTMRYYEVPVTVLESAPELERWARRSVIVAESELSAPPTAALRKRATRSPTPVKQATSTVEAPRVRRRR